MIKSSPVQTLHKTHNVLLYVIVPSMQQKMIEPEIRELEISKKIHVFCGNVVCSVKLKSSA